MAILRNLDNSEYLIPGFLPDGKSLMLPVGTILELKDKADNWALYINKALGYRWLARKATYNNILGWKVTILSSTDSIQYINDYVKSCNQCLENF
jgi:hypothetical protein